ncbi:MAG: ion transporter [Hyphomonadaceae bacterium]|nr:ion transporter [Hyphomonadaceae bacterium]
MTLKGPENFVATSSGPPAGQAVRPGWSPLRVKAFDLVHSDSFRNAILGVIIFNAICLGLDTDRTMHTEFGGLLAAVDTLVTVIFAGEILLKLYADRGAFWKDGWNVFDFIVVALSILLLGSNSEISVLRVFRLVRVVRVIRVFRLFGVVPALRRVVDALFAAIPGMSAIIAVLVLLFYVAAVITTDIFGAEAPTQFGSIGASIFTLFQIMTGDGWSDVVRDLMSRHWWAWMFFIPFIVLTSFAVLNLFIAVIVDALQSEQAQALADAKTELAADITEVRTELEGEIEEAQEEISEDLSQIEAAQVKAADERAEIMDSLAALRAEIAALRAELPPRS